MMACALAITQPTAGALAIAQPTAALAPRVGGSKTISSNLPVPRPAISGRVRRRSRGGAAKAVQGSSEPSSGSVVKYVKGSLNTAEDIFALAGIGFAAIAALWASMNLIEVIDKLPVLPLLFELIGILVAWTFIYGNLLFKPDREEFLKSIKSNVSRILGQ